MNEPEHEYYLEQDGHHQANRQKTEGSQPHCQTNGCIKAQAAPGSEQCDDHGAHAPGSQTYDQTNECTVQGNQTYNQMNEGGSHSQFGSEHVDDAQSIQTFDQMNECFPVQSGFASE